MQAQPSPSPMEEVYAALAQAIDRMGPKSESLFLSKLALLMAHRINDPEQVLTLIDEAEKDL